MELPKYSIELNHLTAGEYLSSPATFKEYSEAVIYMLRVKDEYVFEDYIIKLYEDETDVKAHMEEGKSAMEAIMLTYPDRYVGAGHRKKPKEDVYVPAWFDLWQDDYIISPEHPFYDLFFTYYLRQQDLLKLDDILNYFLDESENKTVFIWFVQLTLRKHAEKLLQPEYLETINEWITAKQKEPALTDTETTKIKGKIKRERDDKVTLLNQEQTGLLIYCLRKTKVILNDEFLNNKQAGQAFSILTGYSEGYHKAKPEQNRTGKNGDC